MNRLKNLQDRFNNLKSITFNILHNSIEEYDEGNNISVKIEWKENSGTKYTFIPGNLCVKLNRSTYKDDIEETWVNHYITLKEFEHFVSLIEKAHKQDNCVDRDYILIEAIEYLKQLLSCFYIY